MSSFEYTVKRQRRKTLALHVLPDASIEVRAPKWLAQGDIVSFVESRSDWLLAQQNKQRLRLANRPRYVDGAYHTVLGDSFPLHLLTAHRRDTSLCDGVLQMSLSLPHTEARVQAQLEDWYRQQAKELLPQRLWHCYQHLPMEILPYRPLPALKIRKMRSRWGSCSSSQVITLNSLLMRYPVAAIDTVIYHELCHLWEFNHSRRFYRLLDRVAPDWREYESMFAQID